MPFRCHAWGVGENEKWVSGQGPQWVAVRTAATGSAVAQVTVDGRFLVVPMRPPGTDGWNEEQLATLVTRDAMIGTGLAQAPGKAA